MTDASQEQRSQTEREMQQQKWHKFADQLRHSVDTDHSNERVYDEAREPVFAADSSSNGLKSPVSDEQQSDLGTDQTVDESSSGVAEDGFELVINKRNRNQRPKPLNGNVWSGAATHLKELHSSSSSSSTTAHSGNSSTQSSKLRVAPANNTASNSKHNAQNRNLTAKNTQCLTRSTEDGAPDIEQDTSNSSDSAFAENPSPHGSSASLHFMGASENHNYSDSVALSDDEKWPELNVATNNAQLGKSAASPTSPKESEAKSTTPVEEKLNPLEKDTTASNRRPKGGAQWKRMDIDIVYTKPNEKKHGSSKRNYRSHGNSEHESGHRHSVGSSHKRRPQSRKSNVSSDVELQNNNESKKSESKPESNEAAENNKAESHRQAQSAENSHQYSRRDNKSSDQNNRNHRNNNAHRQDQQSHYTDYNRRQARNTRVRHSVPNLFQCQTTVPVYFLSQDYAPENFIQPLASAQAPPFIYPNVLMPAAYPDMSYANAQFLNEYGQQNLFQYRAPFVQMPVLSQNSPFVSTNIPTTIPESVGEQNSAEPHSNAVNGEQSLDEELSQLLRRVFIGESDKSLRDLTDNLNIISQLNYPERCLILRCQMQFYFSPDNLAKDLYLRSHMDEEGFVPLGLFVTFPRIKNLALDSNSIVNSLATSPNFELRINEQEVKIRAKTVSQEWVATNNLTNGVGNSIPSTTVPSPHNDSAANVSQTKRLSQAAMDEISVDDVRARLMSRSKQSPVSSEHPNEPTPKSESPESQPGEEVEDQWTVCKKKTRQPSANGTVQHEAENNMGSKPPSGKSPRTVRQ